jgi:hypothetical protein
VGVGPGGGGFQKKLYVDLLLSGEETPWHRVLERPNVVDIASRRENIAV